MSFSFGFFEGVDNLESGDRVPTTSGVNECTKISFKPWWIRIAEDAALAKQNHSNCLRFINREEFLSFQQAYQMTGIVPHQTNTTIRIDETFEVNVVRPDKEMKVDDVVTDLIPGLYEGGYKLWECSIDLAEYLARNHCSLSSSLIRSINSQPLRILELGCGIGVPGIVGQALLPLGTQLWLSDFNDSVLLETTWPTLEANALPNQHADTQAVRYTVAGDWLKLSAWLKEHNEPPFDLILSAETLYSPSHCEKVAYFLTHHLRPQSGMAVLSNKRFYFGVGGGSTYFADILQDYNNHYLTPTRDGTPSYQWSVETVQSVTDGASNIRDIQVLRLNGVV